MRVGHLTFIFMLYKLKIWNKNTYPVQFIKPNHMNYH